MTPDVDRSTEPSTKPPKQGAAPRRAEGPRAPVLTASLIVLGLLVALGGWLVYGALTRPLTSPADPTEVEALDAQLTRIETAARPIATAFASESETAPIDLSSYRGQVDALRTLVDSTSDLEATSPDTLEIRDLVLTGGSQMVEGMELALDAAASNEASATTDADLRVAEGLGNLETARTKMDRLLGRAQPA